MEKSDEKLAGNSKNGGTTSVADSKMEKTSKKDDRIPEFSFSPVNRDEKFRVGSIGGRENDLASDFDPDFLIRNRDLLLQLQERQRREKFLKSVQAQLCFTPKQQFKVMDSNPKLVMFEDNDSAVFDKLQQVNVTKDNEQKYSTIRQSSLIPGKFPFENKVIIFSIYLNKGLSKIT
jgi:hypothetical protein